MTRLSLLRGRAVALAAGLTLALALPSSAVFAAPPSRDLGFAPALAPVREAPDVTAREIAASNEEVRQAFAALVSMWQRGFAEIGTRFATPRLLRYRGAISTACGVVAPSNASYCPANNTIYFDDVFVALQAKAAARELGTDGDMAAVGIIAHEVGHAVAIQLGYGSPYAYDNESVADCLAGAFALEASRDGSLEDGDIDEAFFGLAAAADPTPRLTGNRRADRRILARQALMGHGTREQRLANFRAGLTGGAGACLPDFA